MTKLSREIAKDPDAIFEVEADLPSGNRMVGTIGPAISGKVCASIRFVNNPASDEDVRIAKEVMDKSLGYDAVFAKTSQTESEHIESLKMVRKFMGGGKG